MEVAIGVVESITTVVVVLGMAVVLKVSVVELDGISVVDGATVVELDVSVGTVLETVVLATGVSVALLCSVKISIFLFLGSGALVGSDGTSVVLGSVSISVGNGMGISVGCGIGTCGGGLF